MRTTFAVIALLGTFVVNAAVAQTQPAPFRTGDAEAGKKLVDKDCVSCHAARFADDPDRMYTRADRRVKSPAQLLAQVQACNTNLGKGYFPDEEEHIAAYLNRSFYKFPP